MRKKADPDLVQRITDQGHIVGNHTVHHPSDGMPSLSIADQTAEIMETDAYIKENFGYSMYLFRYPTGQFSEQSKLAIVNNCNYRSVFWSFAYKDWDVNNQPDETESLKPSDGEAAAGRNLSAACGITDQCGYPWQLYRPGTRAGI